MVATYAKVTVTQGLSGTVTIAVEGEAGQIGVGTSNWPNYDYSTVITESYKKLIKNAKHLVITGNVNSTDMAALVGKNANGNNWTLEELDMSRAMLVVPLDQNVVILTLTAKRFRSLRAMVQVFLTASGIVLEHAWRVLSFQKVTQR